jgi:uncharacterized protein (TIGR01244 family)
MPLTAVDQHFVRRIEMRNGSLVFALPTLSAWHPAAAEDARVVSLPIEDINSGQVTLPKSGAVSTAQPDADTLRIAAEAGYVAVIDLRGPEEDRGLDEKAMVAELGMSYMSLPIVGNAAINYANAAELDRLLTQVDGPVLLHCGSGNRVGALFALREKLHGASDEQAMATGRAAGLVNPQLESVVIERLAENPL